MDAIATVIRTTMNADACDIYLYVETDGLRLAGSAPKHEAREAESGLLSHTVQRAEATGEREDGTLTLIPDALRSAPTAARDAGAWRGSAPWESPCRCVGASSARCDSPGAPR